MKKLLILIILIILIPLFVQARSGCCSHHGGVCGCGCCDGTGLSATCAPYYPECNKKPSNNNIASQEMPKSNNSWIGWVVAFGTIGVAGYFIGKNKK